jgi:hypothetical protein
MKLLMENWRRFVNEQEEQAVALTKDTNIADVPAAELFRQASSGQETPLYKAILSATGWAPKVLKSPQQLKQFVDAIGAEAFEQRVGKVVALISQAKTPKFDMPALEGGDADEVADALSDTEGSIGIDMTPEYSTQIEDFQQWYKALPDSIRQMYEAGKVPSMGQMQQAMQQTRQQVKEDKYPRFGKGPFPGAATAPPESEVSLKDIKGPALAFLTKGMVDNSPGDSIKVDMSQGGVANSSMKPTQSNILAAKSLLLALANPKGVTDMGGAFITKDGSILDGHHRWSATLIATGGQGSHDNVHIVHAPAAQVIPVLTTIGNALGRVQKGPDPNEEA